MSSIPYLSHGIGVPIDPLSGLPAKKKAAAKQPSWLSALGARSQGMNQQYGLGTYAGGGAAGGQVPGVGGGGPIKIPGYTPDYGSLINQDALFGQLKLDIGAQGVSDAASRGSATQRALTLFGQVPEFGGLSGLNPEWLNQDVSPQARQLAQTNTDAGLSIVARQKKQFTDNIRAIKNELAARGALRSGEAGHQLQEAQTGYDQARFDTTQELVDFIGGLQAGYAEKQRRAAEQSRAGAESAYGRVVAANPTVGERTVNPGDPGYPTQAPAFTPPPAASPFPNQQTSPLDSDRAPDDWQDILIRTLRAGQRSRAV